MRKTFQINNIQDIVSLILDIDYDDAFVAYINGEEIARANIDGVPPAFWIIMKHRCTLQIDL